MGEYADKYHNDDVLKGWVLMGRMKKRLAKIGENKYSFNSYTELSVYKYLICRSLRRKEVKELKTKGVLFDYYSEWENYVKKTHKDKDEKKLEEFSRHLEQRIRNEQVSNKFISLVIPILLTALLTTVLGEVLKICDIDFSGQPLWVIALALCAMLVVIIFVAIFFKDSFNDILNYQIRENFFLDYKKIIDEMLQNECFYDGAFKQIENVSVVENSITVDEGKIELRNISADVDIEMPNMSIHIKQK